MKKLFLLSSIVFVLLSVIATAQDIKVLNFYDGETYFEGQITSLIAYDQHHNEIYCVSIDNEDANKYRYYVRRFDGGVWKKFNTPEYNYPINDSIRIANLEVDNLGRVWISTDAGILKFEYSNWEKVNIERYDNLPVVNYNAIAPDSAGNVYFQVSYGYKIASNISTIVSHKLFKYSKDGNALIYTLDSANNNSSPSRLSDVSGRAKTADNLGNVWLASSQYTTPEDGEPRSRGLLKYNDAKAQFEFVEIINHIQNNHLATIKPTQLIFDNGYIWFAYGEKQGNGRGGISKLNISSGVWTHYEDFEGLNKLVSAYDNLETLVSDGDSILWEGTFGWGLLKFDLKAKKVERISFADVLNRDDLRYKLNEVYNSFKDNDGNNWFVTWAGIIKTEGKKTTSADNVEEPRFGVFPNPASDRISITGLDINLSGKVAIYSQLGVKALETSAVEGMIDVSSLPAGVYLLRAGGGAAKFVKI